MRIDHPRIQQWLEYNSCGVKVTKFPCFLVRHAKTEKPEIYGPEDYRKVIEIARKATEDFISEDKREGEEEEGKNRAVHKGAREEKREDKKLKHVLEENLAECQALEKLLGKEEIYI